MEVKIKYLTEDPIELQDIEQGDWIDIPLQQNLNLLGNPYKLVPLGIAIQLPKGYEAHVIPRSSTFKNYGMIQTNGMGLIDESYCGDNDQWHWPAYILVNKPQLRFVPKGTRLCQFRIIKKQPKINLETVEHLSNKDRGGLGSTGK